MRPNRKFNGPAIGFHFLLYLTPLFTLAQLKPIDFDANKQWEDISNVTISKNGKFIVYAVNSGKSSPNGFKRKLCVATSTGNYKAEFLGNLIDFCLYANDLYLVYFLSGDTLCINKLGTSIVEKIPGVESYKMPKDGTSNLIAYKKNDVIFLRNVHDDRKKVFQKVNSYYFDDHGANLLLSLKATNGSSAFVKINLAKNRVDTLSHHNIEINDIIFDRSNNQLAITGKRIFRDSSVCALWYYKDGMDSMRDCFDSLDVVIGKRILNFVNNPSPKFIDKDLKILFSASFDLGEKNKELPEIWRYNDDYLPPKKKIIDKFDKAVYSFVYDIQKKKIIRIQDENEQSIRYEQRLEISPCDTSGIFLLISSVGHRIEYDWESFPKKRAYVISIKDGSKKLIGNNVNELTRGEFMFSPKGKYVYWYDPNLKNYFSYNTITKNINNITNQIPTKIYDEQIDIPSFPFPYGTSFWLNDESSLFIYDRYDIWQVDPEGNKKPKCLTKGYGRSNNIVLRCADYSYNNAITKKKSVIHLKALNTTTKDEAIFSIKLNGDNKPQSLLFESFHYTTLTKAKNSNVYTFMKENTVNSRQLYTTSDFVRFVKLSDINKQQDNYNWITPFLVKWNLPNGKLADGIIYKPQNFDSTKKYPVIFCLYERLADELHNIYLAPDLSQGVINIPFFVSNEYLVFVPNIYYEVGRPGESAYNYVIAAFEYLSKLPWIDTLNMGLQGHSFGGYEVNYIITKTSKFKCALSCAGPANMISGYGNIRNASGTGRQYLYESSQNRIGSTIWQNTQAYIDNSPILKADKISTPLLLMANEKDEAVSWNESMEIFMALRRLQKPAWVLNYTNEGHQLNQYKNRLDFTIKMLEFFDYYLKSKSKPKWM